MKIVEGPNPERTYGTNDEDSHWIETDYKRLNDDMRERERAVKERIEAFTKELNELSGEYYLNKQSFGGEVGIHIEETILKIQEALVNQDLDAAQEHLEKLRQLVRGSVN